MFQSSSQSLFTSEYLFNFNSFFDCVIVNIAIVVTDFIISTMRFYKLFLINIVTSFIYSNIIGFISSINLRINAFVDPLGKRTSTGCIWPKHYKTSWLYQYIFYTHMYVINNVIGYKQKSIIANTITMGTIKINCTASFLMLSRIDSRDSLASPVSFFTKLISAQFCAYFLKKRMTIHVHNSKITISFIDQ
jgi:hypothetical protein